MQRTVLHGDICCLAAKRKGGSESDSDDDEDEDEDEYEFDDGDVRGDGSGDEGNFGGGRSDGDGDKCDVDDEDEEPLENLRHPSVPAPVSELPEISMPPPLSSLLRLAGRTEESPFPVTFPGARGPGEPAQRTAYAPALRLRWRLVHERGTNLGRSPSLLGTGVLWL